MVEYEGYLITTAEEQPGTWIAKFKRADGRKMRNPVTGDEKDWFEMPSPRRTREDAIKYAKEGIDSLRRSGD
jgi:hypothetical protein